MPTPCPPQQMPTEGSLRAEPHTGVPGVRDAGVTRATPGVSLANLGASFAFCAGVAAPGRGGHAGTRQGQTAHKLLLPACPQARGRRASPAVAITAPCASCGRPIPPVPRGQRGGGLGTVPPPGHRGTATARGAAGLPGSGRVMGSEGLVAEGGVAPVDPGNPMMIPQRPPILSPLS